MNLKTAFSSRFKIGAAISRMNLDCPGNMKFLLDQFNSFTVENDMKPMFFLDNEEMFSEPQKYDLEPKLCFDFAIPYLYAAFRKGRCVLAPALYTFQTGMCASDDSLFP